MYDLNACRQQFPALARQAHGQPVIYLDGPAGTQVPESVIQAIGDYLRNHNANHGGLFDSSLESDALLDQVHAAAAELVNAREPSEVVFGPNMTTLTFAMSRALARTWKAGDEVVVTRLDHDANVTPWVRAARDAGALVRLVDVHPEDCTLDLESFRTALSQRTRLVAVGCASNSVGTVNPVQQLIAEAHQVGALVYLDAVHLAAHRLPDVQAWDADFLACSAYKFFGPHIGVLWGRRSLLEEIEADKVRPAPDELPGKWMTGTQNHECLAGTLAAIDYLASLAAPDSGATRSSTGSSGSSGRRAALEASYQQIQAHEESLARQFLEGCRELPQIRVWGLTDTARLRERVSTFSVTHARLSPSELARELGNRGIFAWHGNYYALELSERLGREPEGMVRIGMVHYNTADEVDRLLQTLAKLS